MNLELYYKRIDSNKAADVRHKFWNWNNFF